MLHSAICLLYWICLNKREARQERERYAHPNVFTCEIKYNPQLSVGLHKRIQFPQQFVALVWHADLDAIKPCHMWTINLL